MKDEIGIPDTFLLEISTLLKEDSYLDAVEKEFEKLVESIKNIENTTKEAFQGMNTLKFE
jgi:hypothetical protein